MTLEELRNALVGPDFNSHLGFEVVDVHSDGISVACDFTPQLRNYAGVLHGGVTATLADAAVGIALTRHFGGRRGFTTAELKINYMRPVKEGRIVARSHLLKVGTKLCVASVEIRDAHDKICAAALMSYMIL